MATEDKNDTQNDTDELELSFEPLDGEEDTDVADLDELDEDQEEIEDEAIEDEELDEEEEEIEDDSEDESDIPDEDQEEDESDEDDPEEPEEEPSVVENIITTLGYEFTEEELEGVEDTEEGLTTLVDRAGKKVAEDRFNKMVEASPNVKALYEYEQMGGDPNKFIEAFYPQTDYNTVEVSEDDTDTQKEIIKQSLKTKGLSDERIQRNLQAIEDSGNLLDEAKDSLTDLREAQKNEKERIKQETEQSQKEAQQEAEKMWNTIEETVDKGNVANIPVPKKQKDDFLNFIRVDPEEGYSPRDKKFAELNLEQQLAFDAILFHGLDALNELVDKRATTKTSKTLRDKLKSSKKRGKSSTQDPDLENEQATVEDLDFRIDE